MKQKESHPARPSRDNHFQFLRFVAAVMIIVSHGHCIVLGGQAKEPLFGLFGRSIGMMALDAFFVISGFVVAGSLVSRPRSIEFLVSMWLRLWPGLAAMLVISVIFCALLFSPSPERFLSSSEVTSYILGNLFPWRGMQYSLPGLFPDNPIPGVLNASLWTLPKQVKFYLLAILVFGILAPLFARWKVGSWKSWLGGALWVASMAMAFLTSFLFMGFSRSAMPWLFFSGGILLLRRKGLMPTRLVVVGTFAGISIGMALGSWGEALYYGLIPHVVVALGHVRLPWLLAWNRNGDYSYGLYLYGFPVQQSVLALWPGLSIWSSIATTLAIVGLAAFASWHLVESPALRCKGWIQTQIASSMRLGAPKCTQLRESS
ncbi:MAG: acyltransferase [Fibrobacteres bacterium]|jgi:peptidoglycan/LPS O-acetylase OafA/YrhL|nr:acyltransferase [Fibrobacterota bacterium]